MSDEITNEPISRSAFPLLNRLELSDEEFRALARQGSIRSEKRGSKTIVRLRYRLDGRQHVRYVSPHDPVALEAELATLQRRVRAARRVAALSKVAREA